MASKYRISLCWIIHTWVYSAKCVNDMYIHYTLTIACCELMNFHKTWWFHSLKFHCLWYQWIWLQGILWNCAVYRTSSLSLTVALCCIYSHRQGAFDLEYSHRCNYLQKYVVCNDNVSVNLRYYYVINFELSLLWSNQTGLVQNSMWWRMDKLWITI